MWSVSLGALLALLAICALGWLGSVLYGARTSRPLSASGEVDYAAFEPQPMSLEAEYVMLGTPLHEVDGEVVSASVHLAADPSAYGLDFPHRPIEEAVRGSCGLSEDASVTFALYDELCLTELSPDEIGGDGLPAIPDRCLLGYIF